MNGSPKGKDRVEVSSDQLRAELIEIKERLGALETIASISNVKVVAEYVRIHLKTDKAKAIMRECAEPRTREQLIATFHFNSGPALDHHLKPLKDADLIQQHFDESGPMTYQTSKLFRGLPNSTVKELLTD
jgi:DNA-binding transcriptional ArsR family regulator